MVMADTDKLRMHTVIPRASTHTKLCRCLSEKYTEETEPKQRIKQQQIYTQIMLVKCFDGWIYFR